MKIDSNRLAFYYLMGVMAIALIAGLLYSILTAIH
jgi:hypothetical protein